ncbi:hypothetical protein ACMGE7_10500 [Macrococcus equi]|uniref:hypothetical protein n=1 Tax=Macrococcus equi TaxID=3395462 RepID=UPI0039BDCF0E
MIDILLGIIVFLLEAQYIGDSISKIVKCDLIYRVLTQDDNLRKFHEKISLFLWEGRDNKIEEIDISKYTGEFLINKTRFDLKEMHKLMEIKLENPDEDIRFYRGEMGYKNSRMRMLQGYLAEINNIGRNDSFLD